MEDESSTLKSSSKKTKSIKTINEIKNKHGKTSFFIVNYNEGGYVIISAEKRTQPILAFSVNNKFIVDENSYPLGLKFWMDDANEQIEEIQLSNIEQSPNDKIAWDLVQQSIINEVTSLKTVTPPPGCYEHTVITTKGPLLKTAWDQRSGFNFKLIDMKCNGIDLPVYAGCAPIAMAQVMKYYQKPTNYNWSLMPLTTATLTTQNFIKDIHVAIRSVNSIYPKYECTGTAVSSSLVGTVLISKFNYSSAIYADYNTSTIKSNINSNRPVILRGTNSTNSLDEHMWVCDGYRTTNYMFNDCTGYTLLHLHMNWGNNGDYNDWYSFDNFNPGNKNYNSNKKMIYNIIPK